MLRAILKEILTLLSAYMDEKIKHVRCRAMKIFIALNLFRLAFFLILVGLVFIGWSFYRILAECLGPTYAPMVVGVLFIFIAALLFVISKNLIRNKK